MSFFLPSLQFALGLYAEKPLIHKGKLISMQGKESEGIFCHVQQFVKIIEALIFYLNLLIDIHL